MHVMTLNRGDPFSSRATRFKTNSEDDGEIRSGLEESHTKSKENVSTSQSSTQISPQVAERRECIETTEGCVKGWSRSYFNIQIEGLFLSFYAPCVLDFGTAFHVQCFQTLLQSLHLLCIFLQLYLNSNPFHISSHRFEIALQLIPLGLCLNFRFKRSPSLHFLSLICLRYQRDFLPFPGRIDPPLRLFLSRLCFDLF